jgi:putative membrane protein
METGPTSTTDDAPTATRGRAPAPAERTSHPASLESAKPRSLGRDLLVGMVAGLAASAVSGVVDDALAGLVSAKARRRERRLRRGSPHELAGPTFARKIAGRRLSAREEAASRLAFGATYGIVWGAIHAAVRRRVPAARRLAGLPFAVPFFAACDGAIAPLLGLTPPARRLPWQVNAKELGNHVAWTATAELAHRAADRWLP